ncbi:hypothetical protein FEM48_Zijuj10G0166500 [Ziziphus jujuba var. spinosa]|uniref:Uncharacterized protein n=1 Tax=Ziziphus jujuba var. spinosa TaxID=714518 RepID=A0A978UPI3_ZIZJJ|nr:hypothetical protein FEM48_Zijuj10G0166500 [Ziziphus jujuba var. spinosa]
MDQLSELYVDGTANIYAVVYCFCFVGYLRDCKYLLILLKSIPSLISLKTLNVSGCSQVQLFPEKFESLKQLEQLGASTLYRHDEEEFMHTINHCMALVIENKDPISHVKSDNERNKMVLYDGHDPQHERLEGPNNANPMYKGKQVLE